MPGASVNVGDLYQRPASVNDHAPQHNGAERYSVGTQHRTQPLITASQEQNFIQPSDGLENDPLERWKGCAIFSFGFGGATVTSFPKRVPRYSAAQTAPMIKCSPGEVKIQTGPAYPPAGDFTSFPGPLKSKSKKKEVLDWLKRRTDQLESMQSSIAHSSALPDPRKHHEENVVLWRVVHVLVEYDGSFSGNLAAERAMREILSPELASDQSKNQATNWELLGIRAFTGAAAATAAADSNGLEVLRQMLLHGEREKGVWHAVDHRQWAHAMLLASTLDKKVWRQVLQEFIRNEVRTCGQNTESLAALYEVFAGNLEESIDELVPQSARAGLQMLSKVSGAGPTRNALDGLDRWRETLTLILSNRSQDDVNAIFALGKLLANYGRVEAAQVCFLFAQTQGMFGGSDDPQTAISLLGADHRQLQLDSGSELDAILLTEVYEFARTVLSPSANSEKFPHLQAFKLYHSLILAEQGYRSEAQQYCEAVLAAMKSTTRLSPYYHGFLFGTLEDLMQRLQQTPKDASASWISKPNMDKVSGSLYARFNQFIAGDESDVATAGSGKTYDGDAGPFARIAGDTPSISRSPSSNDLYGGYQGIGAPSAAPALASNARYAPAGAYGPQLAQEQQRKSQEFSPPAQNEGLRPIASHQHYSSRPTSSSNSYNDPRSNPYKPLNPSALSQPPTESYFPSPPPEAERAPNTSYQPASYPYQEPNQPTPPPEPQPPQNQYQESEDPQGQQSSFTYEPPATSSYEPTSYTPYEPDGQESPVQEKKKSFMDEDDDDFASRPAAVLKQDKAQKDRAADEAFRKAAEEDAKREPKLSNKKSWFGGWGFGGKRRSKPSSAKKAPSTTTKS